MDNILNAGSESSGKIKQKSVMPWVLFGVGVVLGLSIYTASGDLLGTMSIELKYYYDENSICTIENKSYEYKILFSVITSSMDGFFVFTNIHLQISEGYLEFKGDTVPEDENISIILMFSPIIYQNENFYQQSEPITTKYDGNKKYTFSTSMDFSYFISGIKQMRPVIMENGNVSDGTLHDYNFTEVQPSYMKTQLNLSKATVILTYWVALLALITVLFEYKRIENDDDDKKFQSRENKMKIKTILNFLILICVVSGFFFLIYGFIILTPENSSLVSILFTVGWGQIAFAFALYSISLAKESDEKMKSVVNTEFLHAVNMLEDARIEFIKTLNYIDSLTAVPPPTTPPTPNPPTIPLTPGYSPELFTWKTKSSIEMAVELLKRDKDKKYIEKRYRDKLFDYFVISFNHLFKYPGWWNQKKSLSHLASCYAMLEEHYDNTRKTQFNTHVNEHFIDEVKKAEFLALIQSAKESLSKQQA